MNRSNLVCRLRRADTAVCALAVASLFCRAMPGQTGVFAPAEHGCAMAHCDSRMNDLIRLDVPTASNSVIFNHDTLSAGKGLGLGCSSDGDFAACSYSDPSGDNLVFYNAAGKRLYASGSLLDSEAYASAPLISSGGDVIAADDQRVVRLTRGGTVVWNTPFPVGIPISPITTEAGIIIIATSGGPVYAINSATGTLMGELYLQAGGAYFDTVNTPCVRGDRIYISGRVKDDPNNHGALFAVDVNPTARPVLSVVWNYPFGGPSGASPLCVDNTVYFDGGSVRPGQPSSPQVFAVQDLGTSPSLLWNETVPDPLPANMAADPRGGVWALFQGYSSVERFDNATGAVIESIDVTQLIGDETPNYPYSGIMVSGSKTEPILLLGTTAAQNVSSYVVAIDLVSQAALWKIDISPDYGADAAPSQFAAMRGANGRPVLVFAGKSSGAYFVGAP